MPGYFAPSTSSITGASTTLNLSNFPFPVGTVMMNDDAEAEIFFSEGALRRFVFILASCNWNKWYCWGLNRLAKRFLLIEDSLTGVQKFLSCAVTSIVILITASVSTNFFISLRCLKYEK